MRTPLRYPGGKNRLAGFLGRVIGDLGMESVTYLEPYAGGAGAGLSLLYSGAVQKVVINDLDTRMWCFWKAATESSEEFAAKLGSIPLTVDEWRRQREIYKRADDCDWFTLGFATFYLNRTNRSGILNAGVIGGLEQGGKYKIDARFNRAVLAETIRWIGSRRASIEVHSLDGVQFLTERLGLPDTFAYIDPPYFDKGSFLYLNSFTHDAHTGLAELLKSKRSSSWVLTYDDVPTIRSLYRGMHQGTFSLPYSAHKVEVATERMVLSDDVAAISWVMA